ncbi:helix-turn-helix transcriptional regulator [Prevotella melaninogenica]|uniref:helix-turn-helix domain-containing protein n=1 Tax=Prevotella melaninogenica TaxID=28132 RepID=UPI001BA4B529|nr:helix-turn-helix transcriptional regulator [Prevotella melaninogenica]QUB63719.1 helix-turn-helix transcriptional regulator [Prevotella melaninogenica]
MNLKKVIKEHGWTLERLASEMKGKDGVKGVSQPSVSSIINGNPTFDKLQEIASIIGVSVSELVADEKDAPNTIICPHCGEKIVLEAKKVSNNAEK